MKRLISVIAVLAMFFTSSCTIPMTENNSDVNSQPEILSVSKTFNINLTTADGKASIDVLHLNQVNNIVSIRFNVTNRTENTVYLNSIKVDLYNRNGTKLGSITVIGGILMNKVPVFHQGSNSIINSNADMKVDSVKIISFSTK